MRSRSSLAALSCAVALLLLACGEPDLSMAAAVGRPPRLDPDYSGVTVPPNIAPLNFAIREEGAAFHVVMRGSRSDRTVGVWADGNTVRLDPGAWRDLLAANAGGDVVFDVHARSEAGQWHRYSPVVNRVAQERIDPFVAYRLINPGYVLWWEMGIYQRDLESFAETTVFSNRATGRNCMNCHSFCWNDPGQMMFHMRAGLGGTVLVQHGRARKVDTSTEYTMSAGVYPAWHPDGRHIAFSVNKISQSFHNRAGRRIHVSDSASDLIVYDVENNTVTTSPRVSTRALENLPAWSPEGEHLYFCRGPEPRDGLRYSDYRYDLARIRCDVSAGRWGEVEVVLPAAEWGRSASFPRVSPDGERLLLCGSDYGYFSIHFASSDLYMLELASGHCRKLDVSSEESDSFHSWSSNSRWFVFASKRRDGLCSRLYFSYVDAQGRAHKPFLLPQEDPAFYDTFARNYNVPELITGAVPASHWQLMRAARATAIEVEFDPTVDVDALSAATRFQQTEM